MSVTVRPYRRGGFEVDIQWRSQDGRRQRERKRIDTTSKTAAQRWGEGRERELLIRGPTVKRKEVPTLQQFAPRFMDGHARANQAKPSGIAHKELVLKNHLFPTLGKKRLDDITDEDVQQLKFTLRHRKPTTVNNVLSVLSMPHSPRKCRSANARPEPDFRYASNALAVLVDANSIDATSVHGRPVAVWLDSPRLCAATRAWTSDVRPVYQRCGCDWLRRM